jgi:hypothetical protein
MNSDTLCKRTISIVESGMTTLRFEVQHDEPEAVHLTLEEQLPDDVDLDTVAVGPSDGKWVVYDNGTAQWSVSVRPDDAATATIGVVCTDPDAVDALADNSSSHVIVGSSPAPPGPEGQAVDTIEPAALDSATANERVPESVYERVRKVEDLAFGTEIPVESTTAGDSTADRAESAESAENAESAESAESADRDAARAGTAVEGSGHEPGPAVADGARTGSVVATEDGGTATEAWQGDPLENALRVQDQRSRADETAYRFVLSFDDDARTDAAVDVLRGLLNGTTVFAAEPTLPELEGPAEPDELAVTLSSALDEDALVGALEDVGDTSVAAFETLDVDLTASTPDRSNAAEQFREVDEATERAGYDEFEDEVDDIDTGAFDFGDESVSFTDLVEDPEGTCEAIADAEDEGVGAPDDGQATERVTDGDGSRDDGRTAGRTHDAHGTADVERVTERLLTELEQGGVTERERIELRRRLGVDPQTSTEARLDHLHARVDELDAYTSALEAFLDEEGTAQTLLADLTEDVTMLASRTDDLDDRIEANATTAAAERESLEDRLSELTEVRDADRERVDGIADDVDRNANAVDQNAEDLERLAEDVDARLETLQESVDTLESMASTFDDRLADVEDALAGLEETVEENTRIREGLKSITM